MGKRARAWAKRQLDDPTALFAEGDRHHERGEWEHAAACYQQAWAVAATHDVAGEEATPSGWHRTGLALVQLGRHNEAGPYLRRALADYLSRDGRRNRERTRFALAGVYAMLDEREALFEACTRLFAQDERYVARAALAPEFMTALQDPDVRAFFNRYVAQIKAQRMEFSADELPVYGCDHCRARGRPTDWHDWTMECSVCGKSFSYSGCSCDGCCGGTYAGFGGGRTTYRA
jgi:tetratricopeptide (TPR) repeat protein